MRVAALYDIHGNLPALDAALGDVRRAGVDAVVIGGDVVPGPMPRECMARLLALDVPAHFIRGNGDRGALAELGGGESGAPEQFRELLRWSGRQLLPEQRQAMENWPATLRLDVEGLGIVLFCHATPRSDTEIFTALTPDGPVRAAFAGADAPTVVCGHTHMQFDRQLGAVRVVNAGSVGMPFGQPGAHWLLLGPDVRHRCTSYDLRSAAADIRATSYPGAEEFADRSVLHPPSAEEMQGIFAQAGLR